MLKKRDESHDRNKKYLKFYFAKEFNEKHLYIVQGKPIKQENIQMCISQLVVVSQDVNSVGQNL